MWNLMLESLSLRGQCGHRGTLRRSRYGKNRVLVFDVQCDKSSSLPVVNDHVFVKILAAVRIEETV